MIIFDNKNSSKPLNKFYKIYKQAELANQSYIEAACISSFNQNKQEVNSRFINIKKIFKNNLYFYTNYNSPKAYEFQSLDKVSLVFFWDSISYQIRIKANIEKTSKHDSDAHFLSRTKEKNKLAIVSNQSQSINSYEEFKELYNNFDLDNNSKVLKRPDYWGGYILKPFYFEFWQGKKYRINKRISYTKLKDDWKKEFLQP